MDSIQAFELEKAQARIGMSDGELMQCARTIAHNASLKSFAELSYAEASELIGFLDIFERQKIAEELILEAVSQ